jgi:hypothetical protein
MWIFCIATVFNPCMSDVDRGARDTHSVIAPKSISQRLTPQLFPQLEPRVEWR